MTELEKAEAIARIAIKNGKEKNLVLLTEECAELIQAVSKYKRTGNKYPVAEEMADVYITLIENLITLDLDEKVMEIVEFKIVRTLEKMAASEQEEDNISQFFDRLMKRFTEVR